MALLTTLVALGIGAGLGLRTDGSVAAMLRWKPALAIVAPVALAVQFALSLGPVGDHWWATILDLGSMLALMAFCFANLRVGGMVVLLLGLALNTLPILVNGETPTSRSALVNAGLVTATAQPLELEPVVAEALLHKRPVAALGKRLVLAAQPTWSVRIQSL